jgi:hypothetical protein
VKCPAGGRGSVAASKLQAGALRRDGVEQPRCTQDGRQLLGLVHRFQRASMVALGVPDPRQPGQARRQRLGLGELATQRDTVSGVSRGSVQIVALVEHFGHAQVRHAG